MTLLGLQLESGESIFAQVVFAAQKAIISRQFTPGQAFPSVRVLATELRIHPKTAHKAIQHLVNAGWLEVHPGIGTVVAVPPAARPGERKRLLHQELEQLVVEARRVGLSLHEVVQALSVQWIKLDPAAGEREK